MFAIKSPETERYLERVNKYPWATETHFTTSVNYAKRFFSAEEAAAVVAHHDLFDCEVVRIEAKDNP